MKLYGTITVDVAGDEILKRPGLLARVHKAFGGDPDLSTGRMRASLEAAAVVDAVRAALTELGATNAVSLVIDDLVVFHDREQRPEDLGDLFLAFHDVGAAIGEFRLLRLAIEHVEAGIHLVLEVQAQPEHLKYEPAVRVVISGRIQAFEPRGREDADAYRARVEPLARDLKIVELAQLSFDSFVVRTRDAIARAMPEARANVTASEARLVVPDQRRARRAEPRPTDRNYDPHDAYYPSPMLGMMSMAMLGSFMLMPGVQTVDASNTPVEASEPPPAPDEFRGGDGGDADAGADW
jgi:hypothetical protein